jgi:hypothetical protein
VTTEPNPVPALCVCGSRGCALAELHAAAYVVKGARGRKGTKIRHRGSRRR